jgi:hypothetical protein
VWQQLVLVLPVNQQEAAEIGSIGPENSCLNEKGDPSKWIAENG